MKIVVQRQQATSESVQGELFLDDKHECFTLEPPYKTDGSKPRAIPAGTYVLDIRFSAKHNRFVPHVENVPGFAEIEIHWGNFPKDTEGCLLVGSVKDANFVGHSMAEFDQLFVKLQEACNEGTQYITYLDPPLVVADLDGQIEG